jgi:hypothetical protein
MYLTPIIQSERAKYFDFLRNDSGSELYLKVENSIEAKPLRVEGWFVF